MGKSLRRAPLRRSACRRRGENAGTAPTTTSDESQLVSFEVAGPGIRPPIEQVQEIVQIPEQITGGPQYRRPMCIGVMTLRNRLLPLVSLREMFGLPRQEVTDTNKIVVVVAGRGRQRDLGRRRHGQRQGSAAGRPLGHRRHAAAAGPQRRPWRDPVDLPAGGRQAAGLHPFGRQDVRHRRHRAAMAAGQRRGGSGGYAAQEAPARNGVIDDEEQFVVFRLHERGIRRRRSTPCRKSSACPKN